MKKLVALLSIVCILSIIQSNAQVGIQAGAVASPYEAFVPYDSLDKVSGAIGFTAGVFYKYWVTDHLSVQPALNLINKRWWEELDDGGEFYITRVSMNYLELPVQVVFTTNKTRGFFVGAGPTLLVGLGGKRTVTHNDNIIENDKLKIGSANAPEKSLTLALNAMVGYTFKHFSVGLNYNKGITNQPVNDGDQGNVSHITLRVSFLFGKQ